MPVIAFQIAQQDFERKKQSLQHSFSNDWTLVNNKFGKPTQNIKIESARNRELASLHQKYAGMANKLRTEYESLDRSFRNIDVMTQNNLITGNPEELKLRLMMPSEANKFLRQPEEKTPVQQFSELSQHEQRIKSDLERFEVRAQPEYIQEHRWFKPSFTERRLYSSGGNEVFTKTDRVIEKNGEQVYETRPATKDELRNWALLTKELKKVSQLKQDILSSDHFASRMQRAAYQSNRMVGGGTLDKDVLLTKNEQHGALPPYLPSSKKVLDETTAEKILNEVDGNPDKARQIAIERGYEF
jgi:hypothetical protein